MSRLRLDKAPMPVLFEGDSRVQALQAVAIQPETPEEYVEAISRLWNRAQSAFLDIGKLLIQAKEKLPHGDYMAAVEAHLPFAARTAYQLREAARWALEMDRRNTITLETMPGSYSTIYLLSTLEPPVLEKAQQEGLIRPELRRGELIAWKRKTVGDVRETPDQRRNRLLKEKQKLIEELRRIEEELDGV